MTQLQAIRWFTSIAVGEPIVIPRNRKQDNWGMGVADKRPRLYLPSNLNYEPNNEDREFRLDFVSRYNPAHEFSDITLTLLHECGHWMTREEADIWTYGERVERTETYKEYLMLDEEYNATEWAIQWLTDAEHRRIAQTFEREYFR